MILEMRDVTGKETATGHVSFPEGVTLGEIFDHDERLTRVKKRVLKVQLNKVSISEWENIQPRRQDRVVITVEPGEIGSIIAIITAVISIVRFIVSLFNQPKSPKLQTQTPTYTFEGLRNTFTPGNVVQVVYGEHEVAGQVLMYFVDVLDRKHEQFSALIGVSEGEIDSIQKIYINQIESTKIGDATTDFRLGATSQSIIPGFETIKNTFFDGREFTIDFDALSSSRSIVYPTVSNDVEQVDLQVLFPEGVGAMRTVGTRAGEIRFITVDYSVRYAPSGTDNWTLAAIQSNGGMARDPFIDNFHFTFPKPGAWDLEIYWYNSSRGVRPGIDMFRTVLQNVTEYRGPATAFSSTAIIAVKGVGSKKIQGGQPTITSLLRGIKPRVYTSPSSFYVAWTQNPAWCVLDYMTNSVYGLGPYVTQADIDIQSFMDFADLADSQTIICDDFTQLCSKSATNDAAIMGNLHVYAAFDPGAPSGNLSRAVLPNPPQDPIRMVSTAFSVSMMGLLECRQCCPHGEFPFVTGVRTPDHFCDRPEITAEFRGSSHHAVGGFALHIYSGSTWDHLSAYMLLYDEIRHTFAAVRASSQSLANTGTILATAVHCMSPGNVVNFLVEPPDYSVAESGYYVVGNHTLWVSVASSWGGVFQDIILGVRDNLPSAGGLNNDWGVNFGIVTLPVSFCFEPTTELGRPKFGGYNDLFWDEVTNVCGTCYCEPTFVDWGCDAGQIDDCTPAVIVTSGLCDICPYGQFAQIEFDGATVPGGVAIRVPSDATTADFTGLVALYIPDQTTIAVYEYSHQPLNVEGSLLSFVSQTMNSGDTLKLRVASGQTEVYQALRNSTVLITTNTIATETLDIFNPCIVEVRSGSTFDSPSGLVPTIATTYFPPAPTIFWPTSMYQSVLGTIVISNDFTFLPDSFNNAIDSTDILMKSGSGGVATFGYKYVEGFAAASRGNAGDYIEFQWRYDSSTGNPITGVCWQVTESGSASANSLSASNFTGWAVLNHQASLQLQLAYYDHQSLATLPPSAQILGTVSNSMMTPGALLQVFASIPVSGGPGTKNIFVEAGSNGALAVFNVTNNSLNLLVPWGAPQGKRFDNTNWGLVAVGNSASGVHQARWSGPGSFNANYSFIDRNF